MITLLVFSFLTVGYFFGQWNWSTYYDSDSRLKILLFPISATHCEEGRPLAALLSKNAYLTIMTFFWPVKIVVISCEWLIIGLMDIA